MKYAAGITLYNPIRDFLENLKRYTYLFDIVIVNDNSKDNSAYVEELKSIPNLVYFGDGHNYGLPFAFNRTLDYCYDNKFPYLCTLDQDSILGDVQISCIKKYIESHQMSSVAIVAPYPIEKDRDAIVKEKDYAIEEVSWVICSGAFLNLEILKSKGIKYDEAYFVDRFDADICKQISDSGLKQLLLKEVQMPHACGDENGHSVLRNYYIYRNRFYYNDKYYGRVVSCVRSILQTIRHFYEILRFQSDKTAKIRAFRVAIRDYKNSRLGEICAESLCEINNLK